MGIAVFGAVFVDIKGYPIAQFIPEGRNAGRVVELHGGVARNIAEDIGNVELRPTFVSVVDDTGIGADVVAKLRRHQVNVDYMVRRRDGLGTWLAIFNNENDVVASISKRPDLSGIADILDEHGDEIISQCDSVVVEIDMRSYILKKVFDLAEKYHKQVYAAVSNMSIAMERRDLLSRTGCVVCNQEEASLLFSDDYSGESHEEMQQIMEEKLCQTRIPRMVITLGGDGAVYAENPECGKPDSAAEIGCQSHADKSSGAAATGLVSEKQEESGLSGYVPALHVMVQDTTGAGDSFFAGVAIGLTYGKTLREACEIGTRLAGSVIATKENVCPRFRPEEFGIAERPKIYED